MKPTIVIEMVCEVKDPWSLGKSEVEIDNKLKSILSESFGSGKMNTKKKGSETFGENYTLSCMTKPIPFTKENIDKIVESFNKIKNGNFVTNENSKLNFMITDKDKVSEEDYIWSHCQMAIRDNLVENYEKMFKDKKKEFIAHLKMVGKLIKENKLNELSKYLKENKENILNVYKADTIIAKFPCNFLEEEFLSKMKMILEHLNYSVVEADKIANSTEINGINRKAFFEIVAL